MKLARRSLPGVIAVVTCAMAACTLSVEGLPGGTGGGTSGPTTTSTATTVTTGAGGAPATTSTSSGGSGGTEVIEPAPTCADAIENGLETDVDCGGDACPPCGLGASCLGDADCSTSACKAGKCESPVDPGCVLGDQPTCADCVKNGLETDIDCGGDACGPCATGSACLTGGDCLGLTCAEIGRAHV
jgi:hypothetical protein